MTVPLIKKIVKNALREDIGSGDVTTDIIVPADAKATAIIYAREKGVVAGLDIAIEVFRQLDKKVRIRKLVKDGSTVRKNQPLAKIIGKTRALLTGERAALNFLQHLSGIATLAKKYVDAIKPYRVKIFTTRKTIPGMRSLEKYAVRMGGGYNYRMGLWEMVMIKDNHLQLLMPHEKIKNILKKIRKKISRKMKIEIETKNLREVKEALEAGADIIMLDNMKPQIMKKAVNLVRRSSFVVRRKRPIIEASGNVTLKNVKKIARTGVNWISIGKLTHSAPALNLSMEIV